MNLEISLSQILLTYTFIDITRAQIYLVSTDHLLLTRDYSEHFTVTAHLILATNLGEGTLNSPQFKDGETETPRDSVIFQRFKVYNRYHLGTITDTLLLTTNLQGILEKLNFILQKAAYPLLMREEEWNPLRDHFFLFMAFLILQK